MRRIGSALVLSLLVSAAPAAAQTRPDLSGLWIAMAADISVLLPPGEKVMLTPYGAERYRKLDQADSPSYRCLPYGPTRGLQATNPFQIVQTPVRVFRVELPDDSVPPGLAAGSGDRPLGVDARDGEGEQ